MTRGSTYHAAHTVAATIETHFGEHLAEARARGESGLAQIPSARAIEIMIDATFWASFRPEEGRFPKISLAFVPPEQARQPLTFAQRLPLNTATLTKLAPAVERPGIHLGVWREQVGNQEELYVWGATRKVPSLGFVLEDIEPGLLVIKHRRAAGFGKFANVAVLKGEQVKIIDEEGQSLPDCPDLLKSLHAFIAREQYLPEVNALVQLAASMRAHGQGGTLLVVPDGSEQWRESIVHPVLYSVVPPYGRLANLIIQGAARAGENEWEAALRNVVDAVAGLTAVDGATVITSTYDVLAFGAKIKRAAESEPVEQVMLTEPIVGNQAEVAHPVLHGGTRHLSAAQFIHDQRDCLGLVASQDGRFTVFAWSPCEQMVHAHRVDVLLM